MRRTLSVCGLRLACIALLLVLSLGRAHAEQRHALLIGANLGWSGDRSLRYAEADAERMRAVLESLGGFAADHVRTLRDPSASEVRAELARLERAVRDAGDDSLVFVYYSGHADDRYLHLRGDPPLSHRELQDTLRALPATVKLAVVDACRSGALTRKGGAPTGEFDVDVVAPKLSGLILLSSSGADELSQELRTLGGSVFTHHLVSGLRGAADADSNQRVTVAEAYHYAYELTRADTATSGVPQRPGFRYELSGQGELVLTRLASGREAQLVVPRGAPQKYVILDEHEWRLIAELRSDPRRDVVLALAPGNYAVKRVLPDRFEVAVISVSPGMRNYIDTVSFVRRPLSEGAAKGEPHGLSRAERYEWTRAQAFAVLDEGQANAALNLFDQLRKQEPGDVVVWRGRARALLRMADSYQRVGDQAKEQRALVEALKSDPSLSYDPDFQLRYGKLDGAERAKQKAAFDREMDRRMRPRRTRRFGTGLELLSARAMFGVYGTVMPNERVSSSLGFDIAGLAFDASVIVTPWRGPWSPYLGLGGHLSLRQLGVGVDPFGRDSGMDMDAALPLTEMFGASLRGELGAQFVARTGFTIELGLAIIGFRRDGEVTARPFPVLHLGWLF